jgi:hypothetical protein
MSDWTDELKAQIIEEYKDADPTPETSMTIVENLAEAHGKTTNGVRIILSKAGVYVKKAPTAKASGGTKSEGSKRVSKQDAIDSLTGKISEMGAEVDEEILSKMTGKAATYFLQVLNTVS